jgi:hypothetical protein
MDKNEKFSKKPPSKASKNTSEGNKRIEYRGDYVRISRTGGIAGRASVSNKKMGIGATVNTKHGLSLHKRLWNGARVGFQKGRFQFIGRYGKGPLKINQSKKGFSLSTSNSFGSYNFFKPQYSSFKMGGYHVRGQTAQTLQLIVLLIVGAFNLIVFSARALYLMAWLIAQIILFSVRISWAIMVFIKNIIQGFIQGFREIPD